MRKMRVLGMLTLVLLFVAGCSMFQGTTVQEQWNKLTPDEQARVVLGGLQKQVNTKFDEAKLFTMGKADLQDYWKKNLVPAFDTCNKSLAKMQGLAQKGQVTPDQVYVTFKPDLDKLILYLLNVGMKWSWEDVLKEIQRV
jgi:hypothetical protein